jgi:hypothetical protein
MTLFEGQLIRTYLASDNGDLISRLSDKYSLVLITSPEYKDSIETKLKNNNILSLVKIITFKKIKSNQISKLCETILLYLNQSKDTLILINSQYFSDKSQLKKYIKIFIYYTFSKLNFIKKILRWVYSYSFNLNNLARCFSENINFYPESRLFATSLSPLRGEDTQVAVYFKRKNIKVSGTVRSWDNLVSNGCLLFKPAIMICHSDYMKACAINFQDLKKSEIILGVTPSYQAQFLKYNQKSNSNSITIAYMSMSTSINPDDRNFINFLMQLWENFPSSISLVIVEHPAYPINSDLTKISSTIKITRFDFESTSLHDYYNFLSNIDLIIAGGTTGILDAAILKIPIVAIGFEIVNQSFWKSGLRAFDYFSHTANFFIDSNVVVAKTKDQLKQILLDSKSISLMPEKIIHKYTGNPETDFTSSIYKTLK